MTTAGKIIFGISIAAGVGIGWKYLNDYLNKFNFKITSYGLPSFQNWVLKLPITIQFSNPTGLTINAERVNIDIFLKGNQGYVHIANVNQPLTLPPGKSSETIVPVINLQGFAAVISDSWVSILGTRSMTIRTDVRVTYHGINMPKQNYEDTIRV